MKILIVVDMQNDFLTGSLANKDAVAIVPKIEELVRNFDGNVIFTLDTHEKNYLSTMEGKNLPVEHCIKETDGHLLDYSLRKAIYDRMAVKDPQSVVVIEKPTFGFLDWQKHIGDAAQIDEISLCGTCTDICVVSNALILKAAYPEVKISCLADLCAGVTPESHQKALDVMSMCQVNIIHS